MNLIAELNERMGMSVLFITHDLGAMAQLCHSVRVMYLGNLVEEAQAEELFARPLHPYTQGLLDCIPRLDSDRSQPLHVISGVRSPPPAQWAGGLPFLHPLSIRRPALHVAKSSIGGGVPGT